MNDTTFSRRSTDTYCVDGRYNIMNSIMETLLYLESHRVCWYVKQQTLNSIVELNMSFENVILLHNVILKLIVGTSFTVISLIISTCNVFYYEIYCFFYVDKNNLFCFVLFFLLL